MLIITDPEEDMVFPVSAGEFPLIVDNRIAPEFDAVEDPEASLPPPTPDTPEPTVISMSPPFPPEREFPEFM